MRLKLFTLTSAIFIFALSCQKSKSDKCFVENDERRTEHNIKVPFNGVVLNTSVDVFLSEANYYDVRIEGSQAAFNGLNIYVKDEILYIDKAKNQCLKGEHADVYVEAPYYKLIKISGSGNIESLTDLTNSNLSMIISGSGNIIIPKLNSDEADIDINGSGNVIINEILTKTIETHLSGSGNINIGSGSAESVELLISGTGEYTAFGIIVPVYNVSISGSGNADISVSEELNASISGTGNIRYKGDPQVNASVSGTGKLIKQ